MCDDVLGLLPLEMNERLRGIAGSSSSAASGTVLQQVFVRLSCKAVCSTL
jgi:hypothetical protein